jgi:hypothetical protein
MEMFTIPLSLIALLVTLWITSFFARLMSAKKPCMVWIFIAWITGSILSVAAIISLNLLTLSNPVHLILIYLVPLLIFTLVYRLLNKMDWIAAITTNITSFSMGVIAIVIVIISLGKPLDQTIILLASKVGLVNSVTSAEVIAASDNEEEIEGTVFTDQDLLRPMVISALKQQKKRQQKNYIEAKFNIMSIRRAKDAIGHTIRLSKKNGTVLEGVLRQITDEQFILQQTVQGGIATTPITMKSVKTLAVYH